MRYLIFMAFIINMGSIKGQMGFNESYDLGGLAAAFESIELMGDTIVLYGLALEEGKTAFGMLFAKADTFGNIIDYRIHYDSVGADFTGPYPNSFIRLSKNAGFAAVGQVFQRVNGYLALFDNAGGLSGFVEYKDDASKADFYEEIYELNDGFLILGEKQNNPTWILNVFVLKTDFAGNIIWERIYSTPNRQTLFSSLFVVDANEYVISGGTTVVQGVPLTQLSVTSKIFAIDSLGNMKWQWQSQPSLEELGAGSLFKTPEGHWAYTSARGWYNATYNEISKQPKFVIRDSNFNLIRADTFGVADSPVNYFTKTIQLNDGGWLAIGLKPVNYPIPPVPMWYNSYSGWTVKLDNQGDQVWSRVDTAFWSFKTGSRNYLHDAIELPGGSIIACGHSRTNEPAPKDWGWLIKISKDGCIDTLNCTALSAVNKDLPEDIVSIYPNPARSTINIHSETIEFWDRIEIISTAGQILIALKNTRGDKIDLNVLEGGVYYVRFIKANRVVTKKIIVGR